nr:PREDICTED: nuclear valosin-containing protein-like [Bemisia tabaci]
MPNYFTKNRHPNNPPFHFSDPQLVPRVRQYIDENRNRQYVDVTMMADSLQQRYPRDYARRKRIAFRGMVSRAYQYLLQQNDYNGRDNSYSSHNNSNINSSFTNDSSNGQSRADEEDNQDDDDIIVDVPEKEPNLVNKQLANLYASSPNVKKNNPNTSTPGQTDQELINLSSDDESNSEQMNSRKRTKISKIADDTEISVTSPAPTEPLPSQVPPSSEVPAPKGQKRKAGEGSLIPPLSLLRRKKREIPLTKSTVTLKDVGGNRKTVEEVIKLLIHLKHPEVYKTIGVTLPRGFLLHGPPGCGKTLLAHAIAGELDLPLLKVAGPELVAGVSGESEERIRDLFEQAVSLAPCILFIDEVDVISSRRESAHRNMEQRIVAQLLCSLDNLDNAEKGNQVLVIGATNRHDSMDPALRRAGRFDREICLGIPDKKSRLQILQILVTNMKLSKNVSLEQLAALTPGYVGADLKSLTREAAIAAVSRICEDVKNKRLKVIQSNDNAKNKESKDDDITIDENSQDITILPEPEKTNETSDKNSDCDIVEVESKSNEAEKSETKEKNGEDVIVEKSFVLTEDRLKESISNYYGDEKKESDVKETEDSSKEVQPMEVEETNEANMKEPANDSEKVPPESDKSKFYCSFGLNSKEAIDESIESLLEWLRDKTPLSEAELSELFVEFADFEKALKTVQPSSKREGFATVPDVTWNDVGSLNDIRQELQMAILAPVQHSELFTRLGLTAPTGVLLCGPPGCGKTLLAKAVANEAGINFISVKGPELLNMYLGESERAVRQCFERARNSQPCVIFFDELDALCPKRSESRDSGGGMRVVNQLLTEMDGVEGRQSVFLMAATNRPDMIDPAVLRPGRLDKILYIGLPSPEGRVDILKALTKNGTCPALHSDVNLNEVGLSELCEGFSGADLAALVREAGVQALREYLEEPSSVLGGLESISLRHFEAALKKIRKSVSDKDQIYYERLRLLYSPSSASSKKKVTESDNASSSKS